MVDKMREAGLKMQALGCMFTIAFSTPLLLAVLFGKIGFWVGVVIGVVIVVNAFRSINTPSNE